jgi:hypothetical protein
MTDAVAGEVQGGVQLVERHLPVEVEQRDAGLPQVVPGEELGVVGEGWQRRAIGARRSAAAAPRQLRPKRLVDLLRLLEELTATTNQVRGLVVRGTEIVDDATAVQVDHGAFGMRETRAKAEPVVGVVLKSLRRLRKRDSFHRGLLVGCDVRATCRRATPGSVPNGCDNVCRGRARSLA